MRREVKACVAATLVALTGAGCTVRDAHPVPVVQYADPQRSCHGIERELNFIEGTIKELVPLFFMSKAEQVEIDAYSQRYNRLLRLAEEKDCGLGRKAIPGARTLQQQRAKDWWSH